VGRGQRIETVDSREETEKGQQETRREVDRSRYDWRSISRRYSVVSRFHPFFRYSDSPLLGSDFPTSISESIYHSTYSKFDSYGRRPRKHRCSRSRSFSRRSVSSRTPSSPPFTSTQHSFSRPFDLFFLPQQPERRRNWLDDAQHEIVRSSSS
jgi:hypothetical protein